MARKRRRTKRRIAGWRKWLLALLLVAGGVVLGAQIGRWTASDKVSEVSRQSLFGRATSAAKTTKSSTASKPVSKTAAKPAVQKTASKTAASAPIRPTQTRIDRESDLERSDVRPAATSMSATAPPVRRGSGPIVAIVLDDWGYNTSALGTALEITAPLTLAVLPHLPYSARIAEEAHAAGHEVMLHMPMEPLGNVPLEDGTILTTMSSGEIRALLSAALASVPHVRGVNNHMGSKGTQDRPTLSAVMAELRERKLFFLNSMTSGSPAGREAAGDLGIEYAERDIFLDNVRTEAAVLEKLDELKRTAIRQGSAIGIGHDKPVTLKAIQKVLPSWEAEGIRVMKLSDLIRHHSDGH